MAGKFREELGKEPMSKGVTAKQLIQHLSPYDLERVTFQTPDGLPIIAVYIDTDVKGGAVVIMSDLLKDESNR